MNLPPWLNVIFQHQDAQPSPVGLAAWLPWALRLLALFAAMKVLSMLI